MPTPSKRLAPASLALVAALCAAPLRPRAQAVAGETAAPGATHATSTDADALRTNAGAVPLARTWSARATHVTDLRSGASALDATALSALAPLPFGFGVGASVRWLRARASNGAVAHVASAEAAVGYAPLRSLGVAVRGRATVTLDDAALAPSEPLRAATRALDGALAADLEAVFRPWPALALSLAVQNLVGPQAPALGVARSAVLGVGLRPTGTDALTLGLDGAYTQQGAGWLRLGARVALPHVGTLRAEGAVDLPPDASGRVNVRAGAALELQWGGYALGGGALFAPAQGDPATPFGPAGFSVTAAVSGQRYEPSLPEPAALVTIPLEGAPGGRAMTRLLLRLERLRRDPTVRGVFFALRGDLGGLAFAEELRAAIARLRADGRTVHCHLFEPTGSALVGCAGASRVSIDPAGTVRAAGVRSARYFLGDALAALGVRTQFVRIGAWKSAPEQFTRRGSTPEARAQEAQLLDDSMASLRALLSSGRAVSDARAGALVEGGPYLAREALDRGLVDAVEPREAAERNAARACGCGPLPLRAYTSAQARAWAPGPAIAVLHLDGDIVSGESRTVPLLGMRLVGDRTVVPQLEALAANDRVRAVVLRVDSGGGDAVASELIWRAVARLAARKPVVVSVGRIAASGAYYLAAPAREIVANRASLVGSIGIFFGKADVASLLARLQVGVELERRGPRADMDSPFRPFTDDELALVERGIHSFYQRFLERVAQGRRRTPAEVNAVAEGRVFLGARALGAGLVDREGGLLAAIDRARALAGLPESVDALEANPDEGNLLDTVLSLLGLASVSPGAPQSAALAGLERLGDEPREGASLEQALARVDEDRGALALLGDDELAGALRWLVSVTAASRGGRMLAQTEWPLALP